MLRVLASTQRRGRVMHARLQRVSPLANRRRNVGTDNSGGSTVEIGGVVAPLRTPKRPDLVPRGFVNRLLQGGGAEGELGPEKLGHLRWMLQKDLLGQDMVRVAPLFLVQLQTIGFMSVTISFTPHSMC
jgi:hypothetical protein